MAGRSLQRTTPRKVGQTTPAGTAPDTRMKDVEQTSYDEESNLMRSRAFPVVMAGFEPAPIDS